MNKTGIQMWDNCMYCRNNETDADLISNYCADALQRSLTGITITDQWDMRHMRTKEQIEHCRQTIEAIHMAADVFSDRFELYAGVEMGYAADASMAFKRMTAEVKADVLFGALPSVRGGQITSRYNEIDFSEWSERRINAYLAHYFVELYSMVQDAEMDVLQGISGPLRTIQQQGHPNTSWYPHAAYVDRILETIAARGVAFGFCMDRHIFNRTIFETENELLVRFRNLGGRYVLLGTRAMRATETAAGFSIAALCLRRAGFRSHCCFVRRERREITLPEL